VKYSWIVRKWLEKPSFLAKEKAPSAAVTLNINSGRLILGHSSEKQLPEVIHEKASPDQLLEVQTRTMAKLDFITPA
jgi:hypothetical protein